MQSPPPNVQLSKATFLLSVAAIKQLPADTGREIAFLGRSNAGKSSMINALCRRTNLARTSKTPGRTQTINYYVIDDIRRLVDLPGLGYAEVSRSTRTEWQHLIGQYLSIRRSLSGLIYLSDIRHPLLAIDMEALQMIDRQRIPICVVLSKADKLGRSIQQQTLQRARKKLELSSINAHTLNFSSRVGTGIEELHALASSWLQENIY